MIDFPLSLFSEGGLGETSLWAPKSGFPQKIYNYILYQQKEEASSMSRRVSM